VGDSSCGGQKKSPLHGRGRIIYAYRELLLELTHRRARCRALHARATDATRIRQAGLRGAAACAKIAATCQCDNRGDCQRERNQPHFFLLLTFVFLNNSFSNNLCFFQRPKEPPAIKKFRLKNRASSLHCLPIKITSPSPLHDKPYEPGEPEPAPGHKPERNSWEQPGRRGEDTGDSSMQKGRQPLLQQAGRAITSWISSYRTRFSAEVQLLQLLLRAIRKWSTCRVKRQVALVVQIF
jgi:hypothetical protein